MSKPAPVWRDATPLEREAMLALARCRYAPATASKRFARSMASQLAVPVGAPHPAQITEAQAGLLWKNCHHYRKQIANPRVRDEAERRWVAHEWHEPTDLIKYPFCAKCLIIKCADDMNGPCKGPAKLRPMEPKLVESV